MFWLLSSIYLFKKLYFLYLAGDTEARKEPGVEWHGHLDADTEHMLCTVAGIVLHTLCMCVQHNPIREDPLASGRQKKFPWGQKAETKRS